MREMVKMEIDELSARKAELDEKIRIVLLPKDPNDDKNVIVEIRGSQAATKSHCSLTSCIGCIRSLQIRKAGVVN